MLMLRHHPQGPPGAPLGDPHHLAGPPVDLSGHYAAFAGQPPFTHSCILEMRKEKSRDAARSRRGKENYEFYELAKLLPLPAAITTQLDKASIIRLSISYLKLRDFTQHGDPPWHRDLPSSNKTTLKGGSMRSSSRSGGSTIAMDIFEQHQGTHILQSLDGFAFALSADGRFLYISETVSIYLGLSQVEMTGSSVFDYIHQQDHAELAEQLGINLSSASSSSSSPGSAASSDDGSSSSVPGGTTTPTGLDRPLPVMQLNSQTAYKGTDRSFCIRMKSTLTKRGCHFKSSGYRVVLVLSHLRPQYTFSSQHRGSSKPHGAQGGGGVNVMGMVAMAIALPPPSINEVRLESDMFVTRLTFEFRVAHCEPRVSDLLDYTAEDLTGKNMYTLCHGQDVQRLRKCHIDLINKGQVMSSYYRLLNKGAGFTWLQTCATVICNSKNSDEQSIICVNYVLSGAEYENCILDCSQMPNSGNLKPDDPSNSERGCSTSASSPDAASDPRGGGDDGSSSRDGCCTPQTDGRTAAGDAEHLRMVAGERCPIRGESSNGFDMDHPKQLDLSVMDNMARYHSHDPPPKHPHDGHGGRHKKRRLDAHHSRKSPPSSSSTGGGSPPRATTPTADALCSSPRSSPSDDKIDRPWKRCSPSRTAYNSSSGGSSAMSVKDLEDVMNKHLPSSDEKGGQPQRSTIQWIGGTPQPPTLPASSLLRQIYVNRESVIRSGAHISGRPTTTYYGGEGAPPTSPEQYEGQYGVGYSAYMDTYSAAMTPPASVSPRDKYPAPPQGISDTAAFSEAAAAAAAAAIPHMHHHYDHLPLKPQVFVHPGAAPSLDYPGHEQQQVYHASGFHLYHKSPAPHQPSSSWYPQPNT